MLLVSILSKAITTKEIGGLYQTFLSALVGRYFDADQNAARTPLLKVLALRRFPTTSSLLQITPY